MMRRPLIIKILSIPPNSRVFNIYFLTFLDQLQVEERGWKSKKLRTEVDQIGPDKKNKWRWFGCMQKAQTETFQNGEKDQTLARLNSQSDLGGLLRMNGQLSYPYDLSMSPGNPSSFRTFLQCAWNTLSWHRHRHRHRTSLTAMHKILDHQKKASYEKCAWILLWISKIPSQTAQPNDGFTPPCKIEIFSQSLQIHLYKLQCIVLEKHGLLQGQDETIFTSHYLS